MSTQKIEEESRQGQEDSFSVSRGEKKRERVGSDQANRSSACLVAFFLGSEKSQPDKARQCGKITDQQCGGKPMRRAGEKGHQGDEKRIQREKRGRHLTMISSHCSNRWRPVALRGDLEIPD